MAYHKVMIDYIAKQDEKTKNQQFVFKVPQGQTSAEYYKWNFRVK